MSPDFSDLLAELNAHSAPKVVRRGGRLVVVPTVPEEEREPVDVASLVQQERDH